MVRYSFLVRLSHPLLHAGLSRRFLDHLVRPRQHVGRNRQADLLAAFKLMMNSNFVGCSTGSRLAWHLSGSCLRKSPSDGSGRYSGA